MGVSGTPRPNSAAWRMCWIARVSKPSRCAATESTETGFRPAITRPVSTAFPPTGPVADHRRMAGDDRQVDREPHEHPDQECLFVDEDVMRM